MLLINPSVLMCHYLLRPHLNQENSLVSALIFASAEKFKPGNSWWVKRFPVDTFVIVSMCEASRHEKQCTTAIVLLDVMKN